MGKGNVQPVSGTLHFGILLLDTVFCFVNTKLLTVARIE